MKNFIKKLKAYFTRKQKYVTIKQFNEMLKETGLERIGGLLDIEFIAMGVPLKHFNNPMDVIRELNAKLDRVIEYLGIEEKRVSEKRYYIKKKKQAKNSK